MSENHDYDASKEMDSFVNETCEIAKEYAEARYNYAVAKLKMDSILAEAYKNKAIKESLAIEKAYLQLTIDNEEAKKDYEAMLKEEAGYKGLEQVLKAREGKRSWKQSDLKHKQMIQGQG